MTAKGSRLIFISRILRDGSGVELCFDEADTGHLQTTTFNLSRLSISKDTYIAGEFDTYVVKKKENK